MGLRVLIVDDAMFMRNMLKDIFTRAGHEVVGEAANGADAVEMYRKLRPDMMTMDIVMPVKSGIEALGEIVTLDPGAVVVICSAMGQDALVMEAVKAGAREFIVKPFQEERVLEVIGKVGRKR